MEQQDGSRTILVTGATGQQGGAVARHLAGKGFRLRALTRKPGGAAALALSTLGVEVMQGDLDDEASLERALDGVWGVFSVQTMLEGGVAREEEQGKRLARLARAHGVTRFVYSSVGSAHRETGIPHFESKWQIEETVRALGFPSWAILRPVMFMDTLTSPMVLQGDRLSLAVSPSTVLQLIAVDDIGRFGAVLFEKADELSAVEIDIAGDALTMPEAAKVLSGVLGKTIEFVPASLEQVRRFSEDMALMLAWFDRVGYDVDIATLEKWYGIRPTPLAAWARENLSVLSNSAKAQAASPARHEPRGRAK